MLNTDANLAMIGTVMPAPADVGLIQINIDLKSLIPKQQQKVCRAHNCCRSDDT
jgi:hypothetical protein